jgi:arylformamidase
MASARRNVIDFFPGGDDGPIVVFIPWRLLAGAGQSFSAISPAGSMPTAFGVAIPSYDLCPDVSVHNIIAEMREACRELARLGQSLSSAAFRGRPPCRLHAGDRLAGP